MEILTIESEILGLIKDVGSFIKSQLYKVEHGDIIEKDVHSLVSYVDIEAEKKLVKGLRSFIPESNFITEENTVHSSKINKYTWIIDPLDGTTNFLKRIPIFSISVALVENDKIVFGVIYNIMMDEMFHTVLGNGAFLNHKKIHVSQTPNLIEAVIATGFPYKVKKMKELTGILQHVLDKSRGVRRLGSAAIDLAYTACGRYDSYYEASINPWDVAAGILLVEEAGGIVTTMSGRKKALFAKNILASNPFIQSEMLELIRSVRTSL